LKVGESASETLPLLTLAYDEYGMKKSSTFEQHWRFKEGRDVQDDPRNGQRESQRTGANVDRVRTSVRSDGRLGVRLMAEDPNIMGKLLLGGKDPNSGLKVASPP
jgi:hypothetical protein